MFYMTNNKKHLNLDLEFLDKKEDVESVVDTKEEKKVNSDEEAQNVEFFKSMVVAVVVTVIVLYVLAFFI